MEKTDIAKLLADLGSDDSVKAYRADRALVELVHRAGGPKGQADRAAHAKALAAELVATRDAGKDRRGKPIREPKHSAKVRREICRHLSMVAGPAEVAALKQAAGDLDVRDMARWALERIDAAEATAALIELAATGVGDEFRIGAINALGRRGCGDAKVIETLRKCAGDEDFAVRMAACDALANHPAADSDATLLAAGKQGEGQAARHARRQIAKARIRLAETLARAGQKAAGKKIYQAVLADKIDEPQKKAAQIGLQHLA
jgi:HEAT repeat protein